VKVTIFNFLIRISNAVGGNVAVNRGAARVRGANDGEAGKQNGESSKPTGISGHDELVRLPKHEQRDGADYTWAG
jgi:hypothetical protein